MLYSQSPPLTAEETLFGGHARDPEVRSDQRVGRRRVKPSVDSPYPYRFGEGQPASGRPSSPTISTVGGRLGTSSDWIGGSVEATKTIDPTAAMPAHRERTSDQ